MPSPEYYRRQAELCLRMALVQDDTSTTYWLVEFAKDLQAKADEADEAESDLQNALAPPCLMDKA
jgi:hypothetical protein